MQQTMMSAFAGTDAGDLSTAELAATAGDRDTGATSDEAPVRLDERAARSSCRCSSSGALPSSRRGASASTAARSSAATCSRSRKVSNGRSAGTSRPRSANYEDPFTMMELMNGKLPLLALSRWPAGGAPPRGRHVRSGSPASSTVPRSCDASSSTPTPTCSRSPSTVADRQPLAVLWKDGDVFSGDDEPPVVIEWKGNPIEVSVTPVAFLS